MLWTETMFHVKKPIIAMLHLDPLPGDPRWHYGDSVEAVVQHALEDLRALQNGGVDGILISNEFSLPYQRHMNFVTPAVMAYVVGRLKDEIRVPFGVDCISDGEATIERAAAVGADFVRGTFCGVYVGDGGLYNNDFSALLRRKAALHLDNLKMLYFINPESDRNLDTRPLADIARSTMAKASPDGLCISANAAGQVGGVLQKKLAPIYDDLTNLCSHFHAVLDYPDEDIEDFGLNSYESALRTDAKALYALLQTYGQGQILPILKHRQYIPMQDIPDSHRQAHCLI